MAILRSGGTAVDAVEMAIKVLEDREITNAGYGSNLAMNGTVECDATIVDHYGRSGAVGAMSRKSSTFPLDCILLALTVVIPKIRSSKPYLRRTTRIGRVHTPFNPPPGAAQPSCGTRGN